VNSVDSSSDFDFSLIFNRDSTPPNTPQRERNAQRARERAGREIGSPETRRTPQPQPQVTPIPFGLYQGPPAQHNPSQEDPFQMVSYGENQYQLTPGIAAQLQNLPPMAPTRGRGRPRLQVTLLQNLLHF
jgi:hypothetical protein